MTTYLYFSRTIASALVIRNVATFLTADGTQVSLDLESKKYS